MSAGDDMPSLNDYYSGKALAAPAPAASSRSRGRFLLQMLAAALFLAFAWLFVDPSSTVGKLIGQGLSMENSWIFADYPPAPQPDLPEFSLPVSGVATKAYVSDSKGGYQAAGLSIQAGSGKTVKASCGGSVTEIGGTQGDWSLRVEHAAGFSTVYKGLAGLSVAEGQQVQAGAALGLSGEKPILFALYADGEALDPVPFLRDLR